MADEPLVSKGIEGLLASWEAVSEQIRSLDRLLAGLARHDPVCREILMTAPGMGAITALTFKTVIDRPERFRRAKEVAAYVGLAPKRHQSGEVDRMGRISRCGDTLLRSYLFEAATVALLRVSRQSAPVTWAKALAKRVGLSKAPYIAMELNPSQIATMQAIKKALDPNNILNPGKIFPAD